MADVKMFNCKYGATREPSGKTYFGAYFQTFSVDDTKVPEPIYVDFYAANVELQEQIMILKPKI